MCESRPASSPWFRGLLRNRHTVLRPFGLFLVLLAFPLVRADAGDDEGPPDLSRLYRRVARLEVPVEEISGWTPLDHDGDVASRRFLVVSDEGVYHASDRSVRGALHVVAFRVGKDDEVTLAKTHGVVLHLGDLIPRLDPAWASGHSILDLEACVPLPGTKGIYLLAGERNPEDVTDGGANRLYVVRYPGNAPEGSRASEHADLLAYLRLPDLPDDAINDRLEAVVATGTADPDTWRVHAFKERTESPDRPPVYFPLLLRRGRDDGTSFSLSSPHLARYPPALPALLPSRSRLGAQADACLGPGGYIWILDRWRREIHIAQAAPPPALELRYEETVDVFDLIRSVPGEEESGEPAAPGGRHPGYGRHEAMVFDAHGWLWLAADLGGGSPSVVTVLAPRDGKPRDGE